MASLIKFSEFTFNPVQGTICYCDDQVHLEHQQSKLLALLIKHHGNHVTREQIANDIWQGMIVEDNTISKAITRLRKVLNDSAKSPTFIKTVPKKGYQFISEFEIIPLPTVINQTKTDLNQSSNSSFEKETLTPKRNSNLFQRRLMFGFAAVCFAAFILFVISGEDQQPTLVKQQPIAITYKQGLEHNAHLNKDKNQLLFTGSTDTGYGIFHQPLSSSETLLIAVNSRLTQAKWFKDDTFIYSKIDENGQCSILLSSVNQPTKTTQISSCVSEYPVELFVDQNTTQLVWQDLSGIWQLNLNDQKQTLLPFELSGVSYSMPSPNRQYWASLTEVEEQSVLSVYEFNSQQLTYQTTLPYLITHFKWSYESDALYHLSEHPAQQLIKHELTGTQRVLVNTSVGTISQISDAQTQDTVEFVISATDLDVFQLTNGNETQLIDSPFPDYNPVLSPNSNALAFASKRTNSAQVWVKHLDGNYTQLTDFPRASYIYEIVWSNNGENLLIKRNKSIHIIDTTTKKSTKLNINAEDKVKWQWINEHTISYIDKNTHSLFAFNLNKNNLSMIKSNVGFAQWVDEFWYISNINNDVLTRYDSDFSNPQTIFSQLAGRYWQVNDKALYIFNEHSNAPDTLVKINDDGSEKVIFSNQSINPLTVSANNKGSFVYHKVSNNEANVYQLKLN